MAPSAGAIRWKHPPRPVANLALLRLELAQDLRALHALTFDEALEIGGAAVVWHPISPWRPARAPDPGVTCARPPNERRGCRRTGRRLLGLCRGHHGAPWLGLGGRGANGEDLLLRQALAVSFPLPHGPGTVGAAGAIGALAKGSGGRRAQRHGAGHHAGALCGRRLALRRTLLGFSVCYALRRRCRPPPPRDLPRALEQGPHGASRRSPLDLKSWGSPPTLLRPAEPSQLPAASPLSQPADSLGT